MDAMHHPGEEPVTPEGVAPPTIGSAGDPRNENLPKDDDERFIVGLVLTYYRRHPQRARNRLLDLLGEVLTPTATPTASTRLTAPTLGGDELWAKTQASVAPLKKKR